VIQRFVFFSRRSDLSTAEFAASLRAVLAEVAKAPEDSRPSRLTCGIVHPEVSGASPRHDAVLTECYADDDHLGRHLSWRGSAGTDERLDGLAGGAPVIERVADRRVVRGEQWLEEHWRRGRSTVKHLALATRAGSLSAAQFSARWLDHAGTVGGRAGTVTIPEAARGSAYVQNVLAPEGETGYDALTEVYVEDRAALRARVEWFAANFDPEASGDLFARSWFLAVTEEVVTPVLAGVRDDLGERQETGRDGNGAAAPRP